MTLPANVTETLPGLIDRAAHALTSARTSAEVLEARDMARVAYDAAKSAGRMAKAKAAHDEVIAAVYRAQADAAVIEARAKVRLADEYDAAQERGEVRARGQNQESHPDLIDAAVIGGPDALKEARKLRDAEAAQPGRIEEAANALVQRGEEPTKAALRREVIGEAQLKEAARSDPDPHAKLRAEYRSLTDEAREEDWIALRLELAECRKRIAAQTNTIADLKMTVKQMGEGNDLGPVVSNLRELLASAKLARNDAMAVAKRMEYRLKKVEAERDAARKSLEAQEIPL